MEPRESSHSEGQEPDISLLLSPSKARLAAASSAQWSHVSAQLNKLFSPDPVPRFERSEQTLTALLGLVHANEAADEERRVLHEAYAEVLKDAHADRREGGLRSRVLTQLEESLTRDGREALTSLAAAAALLSCPTGNGDELQSRILHLTRSTFDAENDLLALRQTQASFEREIDRVRETIDQFQAVTNPEVLKVEEMQTQTASMNRETKVIGMKLAEYQERIKALEKHDVGAVRIEDIVTKETAIRQGEEEIRRLEGRIIDMHELPPDLHVSRKEVERAKNELEGWKRRREGAFEGLVDRAHLI